MIKKQDAINKDHLAAARAVDHLRRQLSLAIQDDDGIWLGACPIEGITEGLLAHIRSLPSIRLSFLLTAARARNLGIAVDEAKVVRVDAHGLSLPILQALADPLAEQSPLPQLALLPVTRSHDMLLKLAKHASLLPAMLLVESPVLPDDWARVAISEVRGYWNEPQLDILPLVQTALPIEGAEQAQITCLRERYGTSVHLVLMIGDVEAGDTPLARIHSSCVTGDILGSLRCDCGGQLQMALDRIIEEGKGILVYLHQEGRGIGIANKLRAYKLQEQGIDTYEANLMLGYEEDERDFSIAAAILKKLKITSIRMLTNNPHKMKSLEVHGIKIAKRISLVAKSGAHNHAYISAKAKKSGHQF